MAENDGVTDIPGEGPIELNPVAGSGGGGGDGIMSIDPGQDNQPNISQGGPTDQPNQSLPEQPNEPNQTVPVGPGDPNKSIDGVDFVPPPTPPEEPGLIHTDPIGIAIGIASGASEVAAGKSIIGAIAKEVIVHKIGEAIDETHP